jgi:hypothetical protein
MKKEPCTIGHWQKQKRLDFFCHKEESPFGEEIIDGFMMGNIVPTVKEQSDLILNHLSQKLRNNLTFLWNFFFNLNISFYIYRYQA